MFNNVPWLHHLEQTSIPTNALLLRMFPLQISPGRIPRPRIHLFATASTGRDNASMGVAGGSTPGDWALPFKRLQKPGSRRELVWDQDCNLTEYGYYDWLKPKCQPKCLIMCFKQVIFLLFLTKGICSPYFLIKHNLLWNCPAGSTVKCPLPCRHQHARILSKEIGHAASKINHKRLYFLWLCLKIPYWDGFYLCMLGYSLFVIFLTWLKSLWCNDSGSIWNHHIPPAFSFSIGDLLLLVLDVALLPNNTSESSVWCLLVAGISQLDSTFRSSSPVLGFGRSDIHWKRGLAGTSLHHVILRRFPYPGCRGKNPKPGLPRIGIPATGLSFRPKRWGNHWHSSALVKIVLCVYSEGCSPNEGL